MTHLDFAKIDSFSANVGSDFVAAAPYPHVIIDGVLKRESYEIILGALPEPRLNERSSDYIFAHNKFENPIFDQASPVLAELREELAGPCFAEFLSRLYGKTVFVDEGFVGGGLHQGGEGSFLDMHADFSRHPIHREWVRDLNILLYLNDGYDESWGGHLEMLNGNTGVAGRVAPVGNRMVIMLTKGHTLHGYNKLSFPLGRLRTSIAAYAYSVNEDFENVPERSTVWKPQNGGLLKSAIAQATPTLVKIKRALLGSSTAKRADRDR